MSEEAAKTKVIKRGMHTLPPKRWRIIAIITDTPSAGEAYLTKDEVIIHFNESLDLPAGLSVEVGTIEQAATGGTATPSV